jgi:N-acetylglutamate synthase
MSELAAEWVEGIERATCAAVPPERMATLPGWLLPMDSGTVRRANCAVPLSHGAPPLADLDAIEAAYADARMTCGFRLAEVPSFEALRENLRERGYERDQPTEVQVCADLGAGAASVASLELALAPSADWQSVYLAPGFDPVDGASRVAILSRGSHTLYALLRNAQGLPVASGAMSLFGEPGSAHAWASIHGMRTQAEHRRQGLAERIVRGLLARAQQLGHTQAFLQVESANVGAHALYARLGFATAWRYAYWAKPG